VPRAFDTAENCDVSREDGPLIRLLDWRAVPRRLGQRCVTGDDRRVECLCEGNVHGVVAVTFSRSFHARVRRSRWAWQWRLRSARSAMASAARGGDTSPDRTRCRRPWVTPTSTVSGPGSGPVGRSMMPVATWVKSAAFDRENTSSYHSEGCTASSPIRGERGAERFEPRFAERKQPFQQERHARHSLMPGAAQLDVNHRQ
jgi:hypothetical protein